MLKQKMSCPRAERRKKSLSSEARSEAKLISKEE
jgi:hypothetical protein